MEALLLDTNVFLRFLLDDVPDQTKRATEVFTKAKSKKLELFVPQIVIFEVFFALEKYYKFSKDEVVEKIGTLLATPYLNIQDKTVFQEALELFKTKNIDFVDCFLIKKSEENKAKVLTFDKNLNKLVVR